MSSGKIFWRIIQYAAKRAWKRFKTFGEIVTNIIYVVAAAVVFHITTKELGDTVIYWALAIPPLLWWVYFIWHSVKLFHRISSRKFPLIVVILLFVTVSFGILYALQLSLNAKLKKQLNPPKQFTVTPKPLPDKIIPLPVISNAPSIVSSSQFTNVESPTGFESAPTNADENGDPMAKALAQRKAETEKTDKLYEINNQSRWDSNFPLFNSSLQWLYDILKSKSIKPRDGIEISSNYFRCLPSTVDFRMQETNVAIIRFQIKTNASFTIAITKTELLTGPDYVQANGLKISCSCGYLEMRPWWFSTGNHLHRIIHVPSFDDDKNTTDENPRELFYEGLQILVAAQIAYLSQTNHEQ